MHRSEKPPGNVDDSKTIEIDRQIKWFRLYETQPSCDCVKWGRCYNLAPTVLWLSNIIEPLNVQAGFVCDRCHIRIKKEKSITVIKHETL